MNWLEKACESVDACVFTGDSLEDPANREKLRMYLGRWTRALDTQEATPEQPTTCPLPTYRCACKGNYCRLLGRNL